MASTRDIIEARRYNQRRLVTAFSSGISEGHEYEPHTPMGPVITSVVLSLVLVIAGVVAGRFAPKLPDGWQSNTLIVVKGTGARYFTIDGVLRPVTNITSARLLSTSEMSEIEVPLSRLDGIPRGSEVGLSGVPDDVPDPTRLDLRDWIACPDPSGATHTWIGEQPDGYAPAGLAVVSDGDATYLVVDGIRHFVDEAEGLNLLNVLGLPTADVDPVTADWLNLLPEGAPIRPLHVPNEGDPAKGLPHSWGEVVIGALVTLDNGQRYVVDSSSTIAPLSDVAYALYEVGTRGLVTQTIPATLADIGAVTVSKNAAGIPQDWPTALPAPLPANQRPCARMTTQSAAVQPEVSLGAVPVAAFSADPTGRAVHVPGGSGALVSVSSGGTFGALRLITDIGVAYSLGTDPTGSFAPLGFTRDDVLSVPGPWAALVPSSDVELSPANAWTTVKAS